MTSSSESRPSLLMADVSTADLKEELDLTTAQAEASASNAESPLKVTRVDNVIEMQNLLVSIGNEEIAWYIRRHIADPDTLILRYGRSCLVASIIRHDLMANTVVVVWVQNPDNYPTRVAYRIIQRWGESRGCPIVATYIDPSSKTWQRIAATKRLTGMKPYKIVLSTGSDLL